MRSLADTYMLEALAERKRLIEFREHVEKNYIHRDNASHPTARLTAGDVAGVLGAVGLRRGSDWLILHEHLGHVTERLNAALAGQPNERKQ